MGIDLDDLSVAIEKPIDFGTMQVTIEIPGDAGEELKAVLERAAMYAGELEDNSPTRSANKATRRYHYARVRRALTSAIDGIHVRSQ